MLEQWPFPDLRAEVDRQTTALLIIDMQYHDAHRDYGYAGAMRDKAPRMREYYFDRIESRVLPGIVRLLEAFRESEAKVVHITVGAEMDDLSDLSAPARERSNQRLKTVGRPSWYPRSSFEHQILPELAPKAGEPVLNKTTIGAFSSTNLERLLRNLSVETIVIAGVNTTVCVETTARDAVDLGFAVVLVDDACAAMDQESHDATMRAFRRHFGRVAMVADVIDEITRSLLPGSSDAQPTELQADEQVPSVLVPLNE